MHFEDSYLTAGKRMVRCYEDCNTSHLCFESLDKYEISGSNLKRATAMDMIQIYNGYGGWDPIFKVMIEYDIINKDTYDEFSAFE